MMESLKDNIYLSKSVKIKSIFLYIVAFIDTVICFTAILIFPLTLIDYSSAALGYFLFTSFIAFLASPLPL